jgi:hypothetical protein
MMKGKYMSKPPRSENFKIAILGLIGAIGAALIIAVAELGVPFIQHIFNGQPTSSIISIPTAIQAKTPTSQQPPTETVIDRTPLLQQQIPDCNNPSGTSWSTPLSGTSISCVSKGLIIKQLGYLYAEVDLDRVNGGTYNQTDFGVYTQVSFQNTNDLNTSAGLIVQTPQAQGVAGGYILLIKADGDWILQQVIDGHTIPTVLSGTLSIDSSQVITLALIIQSGKLDALINHQLIINQYLEETSSFSGTMAVGLIVEHPIGASSPILFSNFELDS